MPWQEHSIARQIFHAAPRGEPVELPRAGTTLENPFVFDSVAREMKEAASGFGELEVVSEQEVQSGFGSLITEFVFRRR